MSLQDSPSLDDFHDGLEAGSQKSQEPQTRRILIYVLLAVMLGLLVLNLALDTDLSRHKGTAAIVGRVLDENGEPIAAEVIVFGTDIQTRANANGEFRLGNVPPDEVLLVIGYDDTAYQQPVKLVADETLNIGDVQYITTQVPAE